jgi:putative thioredoxin
MTPRLRCIAPAAGRLPNKPPRTRHNEHATKSMMENMMIDVTDASFQTDVLERSMQVPVVVDLWAPWCGPCKTLGPILETVIGETNGGVELAKVNVDENPATSQAFQVQGIPAVYAMMDGKVVDGFVGAKGEREVREFVGRLLPSEQEIAIAELLAVGDEASLLKVLELVPDHHAAVPALAEMLVARGENDMALELLQRVPESGDVRRIAALARTGVEPAAEGASDDFDVKLTALLDRVKTDDEARQEYVDLLEVMGVDDPRTAEYRKQLSLRLY